VGILKYLNFLKELLVFILLLQVEVDMETVLFDLEALE
jgi:hypothetical protein